jgi:sugar phosphate isomerase/epimerase
MQAADMQSKNLFCDARLLLSAGTLVKASFVERVAAASSAGFDAISLFPQQYLDCRNKEKRSVADMHAILDDHAISVDEIDPLLDWYGPGASRSEQLMYRMADELGARSINAAPAFAADRTPAEVTDIFARLCQRASQKQLRVDLEFLPWTTVPNLATALQIVVDCGEANASVMLDCWHFFRGDNQIADIAKLSSKQIGHIGSLQVNDANKVSDPLSTGKKIVLAREMLASAIDGIRVHGTSAFIKLVSSSKNPHPDASYMMSDATCSRLVPGEGEMPLTALLDALDSAGCKPSIGLEIFSLDAHKQSADVVASRAMRGYQKVAKSA